MISFLKILFSIVFAWMCYVVVSTCLQHSLFKEWDYLGSIAWMRATLWDFYANILVIYVWICYKESNWVWKIVWLILLITLGSLASCAYVLIQLFKLRENDGLKEFFGRQNG